MVLSPHQPHFTPFEFAPRRFYEDLPDQIELPINVPEKKLEVSREMYRHYLAMILAVDEMVGRVLKYLDDKKPD